MRPAAEKFVYERTQLEIINLLRAFVLSFLNNYFFIGFLYQNFQIPTLLNENVKFNFNEIMCQCKKHTIKFSDNSG